MFLQLLYTLLAFSLFTATSNHLLNKKISHRHPNHSLREIIAGINYAHHDTEEKITAYKQLQRRNLAPKIRTNGSLSEYKTMERLFDAVDNSWSHSDQDRWPEIFPSCARFHQSPIDLPRPTKVWEFLPMVFKNYDIVHPNLRLDISPHSVYASADWIEVPTMSGGSLGAVYRLAGIRWHWGINDTSGSEHSLSQSKYVLEMHAIHYDSIYKSIDEAINASDRGAISILAIFYTLSTESNPGMANIVNILQNGPSPSDSLLLSDFNVGPSAYYFTYSGSLTTPPCHQVVQWTIIERAETITETEITVSDPGFAFRHLQATLYADSEQTYNLNVIRDLSYNGKQIGPNYRQLQPLNQRSIHLVSF